LSDKRSHVRFQLRLDVVLMHDGREHAGTSGDIGLGGMFVHSAVQLPFGADLEVRVSLPGLRAASVIPATVRWHREQGMGLQWRSLRARDVWALNRMFRKAAKDAS
jgi:hypothetical protein